MKKNIVLLFSCAAALMLSSCWGTNSSSYKKLQKQYDSLLLVSGKTDQNLEEMLSIINEVEENFKTIRETENFVTMKQRDGELTPNTREEIRAKMHVITETLEANRQQIARLNEELKKNTITSKSLAQKIARMTKELESKESELMTLRNQLAERDIRISELDSTVTNLSRDVQDLSTQNQRQSQTIESQDAELHKAYYCFGTLSELKEQKIISGGGLFSSLKVLPDGFNKNYFIEIDQREINTIPLFAPRARVRTQHPATSYELVKDEQGNMSLHIMDAAEFWSLGKYLVIEVTL